MVRSKSLHSRLVRPAVPARSLIRPCIYTLPRQCGTRLGQCTHRAVSLVTIQFVTRLVTLLLELQPPPHIRSMLCADKFYGITERLKDLQPNRVATPEFLVHLALVDRLTRLTIQLL